MSDLFLRLVGFAFVVSLVGCRFDPDGLAGDDGGAPPIDASTIDGAAIPDSGPDSSMPSIDAATADASMGLPDAIDPPDAMQPPDAIQGDADYCGWTFNPTHHNPCAGGNPTPGGTLNLNMAGTYTYDTDTQTLTDPGDNDSTPTNSALGDATAIWVSGLMISAAATLRVEGSRPLIFIVSGNINVQGTIDASSFFDVLGIGAYEPGAGANPAVCLASPPDQGVQCANHGASGGGAGGFGAGGGTGGRGGEGHGCGGDGVDGGPGGGALGSPPTTLRGGCAGKDGFHADHGSKDPNNRGRGGPGGGAFHLTAMGSITISGTLHSGGAGGSAGLDDRSSGGAGGSGGYIGLEAATINVLASATLAANGGAGGGGADNGPGVRGDDANASNVVASGGVGDNNAGNGGNGGFVTTPAGQNGVNAERGGGGGGAGVGFILLYSPATPNVSGSATISPAQIEP